MQDHHITVAEAATRQWDAIIIGAGMGGGAAALTLCKAGLRVLMLEKGRAAFSDAVSVTNETADEATRLDGGRWPVQISGRVDGQDMTLWAPLGSGVGGSTTLYAAALHRLLPQDFAPQPHPAGGQMQWPVSYDAIRPYYAQVEALFGVHGTNDPANPESDFALRPPPKMCDRDAHLMAAFEAGGLHPFRLHCGIQYLDGCAECLGAYCAKRCKIDAANGLIAPALATGRLAICAMTEVTRLEADATAVVAAHVKQDQDIARLTAGRFVLAAGGYFSPALLLRSTGPDWPQGLANQNDQVGRNLMFHASEPMAIWPRKTLSNAGPTKTIAVRDFYAHAGKKYGELQSAGQTASYGNVLYSLRLLFDQSPFRRVPLVRQLLRIPAWVAAKVLGDATVFATIVEDYPYPENRIVLDDTPSGIRFDYTIHPELLARSRDFKMMLRRKIKHLRVMMLSHKATLNYGHPCGTCRAGDDPAHSVVDADGKAHGVRNLYVVDGAYMPTSGGTNPSLTIAANAMRIAEIIAARG